MVYDTKMRLVLPSHWLLKLKASILGVYMQNYIEVNHQVAVQTNPTHLCTVASADHIYSSLAENTFLPQFVQCSTSH